MPYANRPWVGNLPEGMHRLCTCGESGNKPYCDGSHGRTGSAKRPALFTAQGDAPVAVCQCGRTGASPRCDGSHKNA